MPSLYPSRIHFLSTHHTTATTPDHALCNKPERQKVDVMSSLRCNGTHEIVSSLLLLLFCFSFTSGQAQSQVPPPGSNPDYQYPEFNPSMAIIVVILIAAMFFMGFFSVYIRYCSDTATNNNSVGLLRNGLSRRLATRGLDPDVILTFPTFPYSDVKELKIGKGALECAVCLNEFEEDETLRLIPKCDHVFHPECIDEWLLSHTTCPVCRANLVPQPGESLPQVDELIHPTAPSDDVEALGNDSNNNAETQREDEQPLQQEQQQQQQQQQQRRREEESKKANGIVSVQVEPPDVIYLNKTLNRNRTRGSRSGAPRKFPRSHSTGHSLVQPGENTDRFTLRLPVGMRKQILNRARSFASTSLPREGSSRQGYRSGGAAIGEGSSRGRSLRWFGRSDRWVFSMAPPFFSRTGSLKSPKVAAGDGESSSEPSSVRSGNSFNNSSHLPV